MTLDYLLAKKNMNLRQWLQHNEIFHFEEFEALTKTLALEVSKESTDSARHLLGLVFDKPLADKDLPVIEVELVEETKPAKKSSKKTL